MSHYTYRASDEVSLRLNAVKERSGWSFQRLCDEFVKSLLYKLQNETDMFRDLTTYKQVDKTTDMMIDTSFNFYRNRVEPFIK